ncbi:putative lipoprotein [Candidatus Rhodobacter oscarellae]|uniref:Putative lipoprotein n=1 Tax=Candidatus Rhodobacter oscarellae TaxID=1675527 RepID=A0A0J9E5E8_9RHOB|nr:ChaN family lipoprotein [Candidatus Rhodobacter lobularis]KMW57972.1 putative lipoprotein [Candidatus Rhodobacter lobularis]
MAASCLCAGPADARDERIDQNRLSALPPADVVLLGEVHDNPLHHENQATAVAALRPAALVFEMFTEAQALALRPEMLVDQAALEQALGWEESGWPDFDLYFPIFEGAPGAAVFGGGAPHEAARAAVGEGAEAAFGAAGTIFGLDLALDDRERSKREAMQMAAHCDALPPEMMRGMVEAQRLRDAVLARAVIAAFQDTGGPVAVITGNGHARNDWGVPRMLRRAAPELRVLTVGQLETAPERSAPFDLWLVSDAPERADPCAAFNKD